MTASNAAPTVGATSRATAPDESMRLEAAGSADRSTKTDSVPNLAASNHTKTTAMPTATTSSWPRRSRCASAASGTVASRTAAQVSQATMIFLRSSRSAAAPARSPRARYGTVWTALRAATQAGEPVIEKARTGKTTIVIPVPANDIVRAAKKSANGLFFVNGIIRILSAADAMQAEMPY